MATTTQPWRFFAALSQPLPEEPGNRRMASLAMRIASWLLVVSTFMAVLLTGFVIAFAMTMIESSVESWMVISAATTTLVMRILAMFAMIGWAGWVFGSWKANHPHTASRTVPFAIVLLLVSLIMTFGSGFSYSYSETVSGSTSTESWNFFTPADEGMQLRINTLDVLALTNVGIAIWLMVATSKFENERFEASRAASDTST